MTLFSGTALTLVAVRNDAFFCNNSLKEMTYKKCVFDNSLDISWFLITNVAPP
jgi:hypothetical protein